MTKDEKPETREKLSWRVGWRVTGAAKSEPVYAPGEYESFSDADYVRREMQRMFPGYHVFVDTKGKTK